MLNWILLPLEKTKREKSLGLWLVLLSRSPTEGRLFYFLHTANSFWSTGWRHGDRLRNTHLLLWLHISERTFWWPQSEEAAQPTWSGLGGLSLPTPAHNDSTRTETCTQCDRQLDLWSAVNPDDASSSAAHAVSQIHFTSAPPSLLLHDLRPLCNYCENDSADSYIWKCFFKSSAEAPDSMVRYVKALALKILQLFFFFWVLPPQWLLLLWYFNLLPP